jgi:SAM-dependent methyltransferase
VSTSAPPDDAIDFFGFHNPLVRWKARQSLRARRQMFDRFMASVQPTREMSVVDVGVTPDVELADSNAFEQFYPYPERLTVTSIEDASMLEQRFPGVTFVRTTASGLPFASRQFDVAFSSAVLEHVGDTESQRRFVRELARVAPVFYLITPNRWFPLEQHTFLPFIHWLPRPAHQWLLRRLGLAFWARTENLNLVSARQLRDYVPAGRRANVARYRILGFTSNLVMHGDDSSC